MQPMLPTSLNLIYKNVTYKRHTIFPLDVYIYCHPHAPWFQPPFRSSALYRHTTMKSIRRLRRIWKQKASGAVCPQVKSLEQNSWGSNLHVGSTVEAALYSQAALVFWPPNRDLQHVQTVRRLLFHGSVVYMRILRMLQARCPYAVALHCGFLLHASPKHGR